MNNEKRTIIAVAICFVFFLGWNFLMAKLYPNYGKSKARTAQQAAAAKSVPVSALAPSESRQLSETTDSVLSTNFIQARFNPQEAVIREVAFPQFIDSEKQKPIQIFSVTDASDATAYVEVYEKNEAKNMGAYSAETSASGFSASAEKDGLRVEKNFQFKERYLGRLKLSFENTGDTPKEVQYQLMAGSHFPARHSIDSQYIEANFFWKKGDEQNLKHIRSVKPDKTQDSVGTLTWLAVKDRHFSVIIKPESADFSGRVTGLPEHRFRAGLVSPKFVLAPHSRLDYDFGVYMGPNLIEELKPGGFDDLVNFGKFDAIAKLFVGALELLHKIFKNYGLSIIALTLLINLCLFPITRNSYMSMKRMQLIQPQMTKLREQYKNSPERLHKEMMDLYKRYKVNPFGGCLPMLIQMPIFVALYVAISKMVPMINSRFLWVSDLSSPDKVSLPLALPFIGDKIHVLPLIMMAGMVIQQKMTQIKVENQDPQIESQQKMMTIMMPIFFVFIFYSMPAALVLYWLTNTVIMASYQLRIKNMTLE